MPSKEELLQQATALGAALAEHERVKAFLAAQQAVQRDAAAQQSLRAYSEYAQLIHTKEAQQQPIEPEEKHKLAELEQELSASDIVKELMRRQADYLELMREVNDAISAPIGAAAKAGGTA